MSANEDQDPRTETFYRLLLNRLVFNDEQVLPTSNETLQFVTGDELAESYGERPLSSIVSETDWYEMASLLRSHASQDADVIAAKQEQVCLEDLVIRLRALPSVATVQEKFGNEVAQQFRVDWEEIEAAQQHAVGVDEQTRKWTKAQCLAAIELLAVLNSPDPISSYKEYKTTETTRKREVRQRLRDVNRPIIEQVKRLGIWFPHLKDRQQWFDTDPAKARRLFEVVDRIRLYTKSTRMIQYIPKRKCTTNAMFIVDQNIVQLKRAFASYF